MPLHDRIIPYLERAGLYHLARLNSHWFWLDEPLVSAFVERWRPETHTFHMPFGECTVTLQDVAFQLGLPIDGEAVSGCLGEFETYIEGGRPAWEWFQDLFGELPPPNKVKQMTVHFTWFHERFSVLPPDLFGDKSANRVHIRWLPFVANLDEMGRYSWGSAALAWLYRCMCRVANRNVTNLAGPLQLLQSWIFWRFPSLRPSGFDYFSFPLASRYGLCLFHSLKNSMLCFSSFCLIIFTIRWSAYLPPNDGKEQRVISYRLALDRMSAQWHQVDRVVPQLGGVQHIPEDALNIDWLHAKDGRGGDRWFPHYYRDWHLHWGSRLDAVISIERVADPGPSADYLDWWYRDAHRFLSPGAAFTDPRGTEIPEEALQRGSSQVPRRSQLPHMPDNRRVERRRRVGTRESGREWRWIYDMLHEDDAGGEAADVGGHRVRRSSGRRRGPQGATQFGGAASGTTGTETAGDTFTQTFTPTMTMDVDDQMGSAHFYSDFAAVLRDDAGPSHVQVDAPPYQPSAPDVVFDTTAYHPHMTEMQPQVPDFQGQYAVDLNQPAGSPLDTWFTMGGTPQSAYGVAPPVDDAVQVAGRPTRVRRRPRCGTGSHLLDPFEDAAQDDRDD
ncbi:hypothetical protein Ahy_Scaffold1g106959 isoform C [Arachis hypogaea]|uniref:Aminotransferase-like plant mobile domain-containing protein n=1 Tax=Arachis hypogaea TaxID=3818 RepID=A0A444WTQ6_ARAHY|nr:hypothetical protein Ahy_Scaffold1g106959 isoform C [Arachis hypogaea]